MTLSLRTIRALIIDVDGVLWRGKQMCPGVPAFFDFLRAQEIAFVIGTNNSARPASDVLDRLKNLGVPIEERQVLTSAEATALYLPRLAPTAKRVFVVGGEGLANALTRAGYELVEQDADAVVAGIDPTFTYDKLRRGAREIRRGAIFVGTNGDKTIPVGDEIQPGAGAIIAALQAATDVVPILIGKPERAMFDIAIEQMSATRETTAALGDRLDTDIEGAQHAGLKAILVMTGVTTPETLAQSSIQPDLFFENLDALREAWARGY